MSLGEASQTPAPGEELREVHRAFLNRYYGVAKHFYDLTRKYYLFGRDAENRALLEEDWDSLLEIGPGTGRNLIHLQKKRPDARYGGVEASDEMLSHAKTRCPFASLMQGFAEDAPLIKVLDARPERILFSYCLSMVREQEAALTRARAALAPGGEVVIVDFADFRGFSPVLADAMRQFLRRYHVEPLDRDFLKSMGAKVRLGPGGYYLRARIRSV